MGIRPSSWQALRGADQAVQGVAEQVIPEYAWDRPPPNPPQLRAEVHVWTAALDQPPARVQALADLLAADEAARAHRFVFERDRRHFIVARGLLRTLLGYYVGREPEGLQFTYGPYGKPALTMACGGDRLRFNLAHSQGYALYALTDGREVGVDIEYLRPLPDAEQIAEHYFSLQERAVLRSLPTDQKQEAFFHCWTRKEAYLKALGDGLARPLDQFAVSLTPGEPARLLSVAGDAREIGRWSMRNLSLVSGYAGALVVEGDDWGLECWRWTSPPHPLS